MATGNPLMVSMASTESSPVAVSDSASLPLTLASVPDALSACAALMVTLPPVDSSVMSLAALMLTADLLSSVMPLADSVTEFCCWSVRVMLLPASLMTSWLGFLLSASPGVFSVSIFCLSSNSSTRPAAVVMAFLGFFSSGV